ncbi:MAG: SpoIID/LytB protein [Solirubrobacterales bacterium]|nr:SpoIID/LytB protein [Solirubrobacterales bacterium]
MDMEHSAIARDRGHARVLQRSIVARLGTDRRLRSRAAAGHRRAGALLAQTLALLVLSAAPASASTLVIEGAGEGHGVGMSQDGALGYAEHGWSDAAILAHYYTATTLGQAPAGYQVRVLVGAKVVRVPLERYVRGVVSAEMPSSWPAAALEAQAIASRTYALTAHAGGSRFDVYSDTRSQMYRGVAAETATTNAAVAATAGEVVLFAGRPATTYYFASSGGMTEDIQNSFLGSTPEPWLLGVADSYETTSSDWKRSLSFASAAARLRSLVKGSFRGIEVLTRGVSPRIVAAEVLGSRGASPVSGPELAARLGLSSTWAYFSVKSGTRLTREPDRSGRPPFTPAAPESPPLGAPAPTPGAQGGSSAPASAASSSVSSAGTGGVEAR